MTSLAMKATIAAKTGGGGGLKQPLLDGKDGKDPESQQAEGESSDAAPKSTGMCNPANILFYAGAGGLSTLWGMGIKTGGAFYYAGAAFGIFFAFYSASLAAAIKDADSINQIQNQMRQEINQVSHENDALEENTEKLGDEADRVAEMDEKLRIIAEAQGTNVEKLVDLVRENHTSLKQMKALIKAQTAQQLVELVMESDQDGDYIINDEECELLILKMKNFRSYIQVHEKNFRDAMKKSGGSLQGVMNIVKTIVLDDDEVAEDEKVFIIDEHLGQRDKGKAKKKK